MRGQPRRSRIALGKVAADAANALQPRDAADAADAAMVAGRLLVLGLASSRSMRDQSSGRSSAVRGTLARINEGVQRAIEWLLARLGDRRHAVPRLLQRLPQPLRRPQAAGRQQRIGQRAVGGKQFLAALAQPLGVQREQPLQQRAVGLAEQGRQRTASRPRCPRRRAACSPALCAGRTRTARRPAPAPRRTRACRCSRSGTPSGSGRRCRTADRRTPARSTDLPAPLGASSRLMQPGRGSNVMRSASNGP